MFIDNLVRNFWQNNVNESAVREVLTTICGCLVLILFIKKVYKFIQDFRQLPPGPIGLPVFGYLAFLGNEKHTKYSELAKKYGSIFSARLGCQLNVVISDYKTIREAFKRYEFTGRPKTPLMDTLNGFGE